MSSSSSCGTVIHSAPPNPLPIRPVTNPDTAGSIAFPSFPYAVTLHSYDVAGLSSASQTMPLCFEEFTFPLVQTAFLFSKTVTSYAVCFSPTMSEFIFHENLGALSSPNGFTTEQTLSP